MANILYITYDGVMEPLGQSQVLSYLVELSNNHTICLISFEKIVDLDNDKKKYEIYDLLKRSGIVWKPFKYHKSPKLLATAFDITIGIYIAIHLCFKYRINVLHSRSYVPGLIAYVVKKILRRSHLFDMRGLWVDERVDGGLLPGDSILYKILKRLERRLINNSDYIISLTRSAVPVIEGMINNRDDYHIEVIPTCANPDIFYYDSYREPSIVNAETFTLGYVGSAGVWYMFDEVLKFYLRMKRIKPNTNLYIVNRNDHEYIRERLKVYNIPISSVIIESMEYKDVRKAMQKMDAGVFFIKQSYSKLASSPTRLAEYLLCGVPCVTNSGVGDIEEVFDKSTIGICLDNFTDEEYDESARRILDIIKSPDIRNQCRQVALNKFSLKMGVSKYNYIYNILGCSK